MAYRTSIEDRIGDIGGAVARVNATEYVHTRRWDFFEGRAKVSPSRVISDINAAAPMDKIAAALRKESDKQEQKEMASTNLLFNLDPGLLFSEKDQAIASLYLSGKSGSIEDRVAFMNAIMRVPLHDELEKVDERLSQASQKALDYIAAAFEDSDLDSYDSYDIYGKVLYVESLVGARDALRKVYNESDALVQKLLAPPIKKIIGAADFYQKKLDKDISTFAKKSKKKAQELQKIADAFSRVTGGRAWIKDEGNMNTKEKERLVRNIAQVRTSIENSLGGKTRGVRGIAGKLVASGVMSDVLKKYFKKGEKINPEIEIGDIHMGTQRDTFGKLGKQDFSITISQKTNTNEIREEIIRFSANLNKSMKNELKVHHGGGVSSFIARVKQGSIIDTSTLDFYSKDTFLYTYANLLYNSSEGVMSAMKNLMKRIGFTFIGIDAIQNDFTGADFLLVGDEIVPFSRILNNLAEKLNSTSLPGVTVRETGPDRAKIENVVSNLWRNTGFRRELRGHFNFYNDTWVNGVLQRTDGFADSVKYTIALSVDLLRLSK